MDCCNIFVSSFKQCANRFDRLYECGNGQTEIVTAYTCRLSHQLKHSVTPTVQGP